MSSKSKSKGPAAPSVDPYARSIQLRCGEYSLEIVEQRGICVRGGPVVVPINRLEEDLAQLQALIWLAEALLEASRIGGDSVASLRAVLETAREKR